MDEVQDRVKILLSKKDLSLDEKVQLLDDLYWADWEELDRDYSEQIDALLKHLQTLTLDLREIAKLFNLYNNLEAAHVADFAEIIRNIYIKEKVRFFKALNLNKEEAINLVYVFKLEKVFEDGDKEFNKIVSLNKLNEEELETANTFFNMYRTICNT